MDPHTASFDQWFDSLVLKTDRAHHHDAVCDEPSNIVFVDTLSGGPSGSASDDGSLAPFTQAAAMVVRFSRASSAAPHPD
ncbi:uncharacterized protein ARMOST_20702 [Armillaria ostoyae]|uniref:Uncharacterized protein n=1 Tax=Armillaria ostoyae TaxID=47428 RepID=A0A284S839_ARMOS|nr:uncharacterized protein ARMOST_20702 [Armillaria ostoyae]